MTRRTGLAASVLAAALWAGPAVTQIEPANPLDRRVSLDLQEAPLRDALGTLQGILGAQLDMEPGLDGKVTLSFRGLTVRTALAAICESAGCRCEVVEGTPPVLRAVKGDAPGSPAAAPPLAYAPKGRIGLMVAAGGRGLTTGVKLEIRDADLTMLVRIFGQLLNAGILVDKSLEGRTVSLDQAAPISKQLDEICRQASCSWKLSESPRRLLEVVPR